MNSRSQSFGRYAALGALCVTAVCASGCGSNDERAIRALLASDRDAHYKLDAARLASNIADTLISVNRGGILKQSRDELESFFRSYFRGAFYRTWDDVDEPIVRIAPGGRMAWVVRKVRVDRDQPVLGGDKVRREFVSAWTATYEKIGGRWQMTTVTSTFEPEPTRADAVLATAFRHLGAAAPHSLLARAAVTGPGSRFEVTVRSSNDGRARIDFDSGLSAAIGRDTRWIRQSPATVPSPLSPEMEMFVRGHEVHMNIVAPTTRFGALHPSGATRFAGLPAWTLTGFDALDQPVEFYYAQVDSAPLGFRMIDHLTGRGPVTVEFGEWRAVSDTRLPHRATFRQGPEVFIYDFVELRVDPELPDSVFAKPEV